MDFKKMEKALVFTTVSAKIYKPEIDKKKGIQGESV